MINNRRLSVDHTRRAAAALFAVTCSLAIAAEDNADAVMEKLASCVACHGADGIGKAPQYPNLQGQKTAYLEKQLRAFRSGELKSPDMNVLAESLSDDDIVALAAYFSNQE